MSSTYQTEEEQIESLKAWWKENGKSVIGGVVLGLAVVGGGKGWIQYNQSQAEMTSSMYEDFSVAALNNDLASAESKGDALIQQFGSTAYAAFTSLQLAKLSYQAGDKVKARARLQWVASNSKEESLRQVAELRLGRILLDTKAYDEAKAIAAKVQDGAFAGEFKVLAGDVALAQGDLPAAKTAYDAAIKLGVADESLLRMKLSEIGG